MEKKKIILEIPCELIDKVDRLNTTGDRSIFISHLLEEQLKIDEFKENDISTEFTTKMGNDISRFEVSKFIDIINSDGSSLGKFDINTLEGFEELTRKIERISTDPAVKIRARILF